MEYYKNLDLSDIKYFCELDKVEKTEQWRDILGYEEKYQISNMGRVKSLSRKIKTSNGNFRISSIKILKLEIDKNGYLIFTVYNNHISKKLKVARVVGIYFVENPNNKPHINHKKGIKSDNRYHELEWSTIEENNKHAQINSLVLKGERHPNCKTKESTVLLIRRFFRFNKNASVIGVSKKLNASYNVVYGIKNNYTHKHLL